MQQPPMLRRHEWWASPNLERPMELLWFGWAGFPVLMFPTSMGRYFQYEDMGLVAQLGAKLDAGLMQLVCVDSVDAESWYNESAPPSQRARRHEQYDAYLREEVLPFVRDRAQRADAATFGCSFGGYHAANFAGRHPELVTKAVCFSGIYDVHRFVDGYWDDAIYFNSPTDYIANMDAAWAARLASVEWIVATGEYDSLVADNRNFGALLSAKGIP